jgi:hypothetical protein
MKDCRKANINLKSAKIVLISPLFQRIRFHKYLNRLPVQKDIPTMALTVSSVLRTRVAIHAITTRLMVVHCSAMLARRDTHSMTSCIAFLAL